MHGTGWEAIFGDIPKRSLGGAGFVPGIPRLGIPDLQMADAAVGVARGAVFGRYSTPLPSAVAEAASWDLRVARDYGALIGSELHAQGYNMGLGGGVNLTREPRNGRTFASKGTDAVANILFGEVNPSAKLPITFILSGEQAAFVGGGMNDSGITRSRV